MLYNFLHYATPAGRRIELVLSAEEYDRAVSRVSPGYFDGVGSIVRKHDTGTVHVVVTPASALRLHESMVSIGGDCAVSARELGEHLEHMVSELWRTRSSGTAPARYSRARVAEVAR